MLAVYEDFVVRLFEEFCPSNQKDSLSAKIFGSYYE
jgi:hypothetical protein